MNSMDKFRKTIRNLLLEQCRILFESDDIINRILDKISQQSILSLDKNELEYLNQHAQGNINPELENKLSANRNQIFEDNGSGSAALKFIYSYTDHRGDEIIHYGTFQFDDREFEGFIVCDIKNKFESAEFKLTKLHIDDEEDS